MKKDAIPDELKAWTIWRGGYKSLEASTHWLGMFFNRVRASEKKEEAPQLLEVFAARISERQEYTKHEVKVLEYLLNEKSRELWKVARHRDLDYAVRDVSKFWSRYVKFVFEDAQDIYNVAHCLLQNRGSDPFYVLAELQSFIEGLEKFNGLLHALAHVNQALLTKAQKEKYLREIRNSLVNHWRNIIIETEWRREFHWVRSFSEEILVAYPRLKLNYELLIQGRLEQMKQVLLERTEVLKVEGSA